MKISQNDSKMSEKGLKTLRNSYQKLKFEASRAVFDKTCSKSEEMWVQCSHFLSWAQKECTDESDSYTRHLCDKFIEQ